MSQLLAGMVSADRPESVLSWMRSADVRALLSRIGDGTTPMTHAGLDAEPPNRRVEHLRSLLEAQQLLDPRDHHLALFERWLVDKLAGITDASVRQPVERFARWHHLERIRARSKPGTSSRGPVHSAKQEITETAKFLTWLSEEKARPLAKCDQLDVDEYLASGPSTRHAIRTFFVWANNTDTHRGIAVKPRNAKTTPTIPQDERLAWVRECLTGDAESLPYRVAGLLLALYAQPIVRLAALKVSSVVTTEDGVSIIFKSDPVPVPPPFAELLLRHLDNRPNLRGATSYSEWVFPSPRGGRHLHPGTIMNRLRTLGIPLKATRTSTLRDLVAEVPAPVAAEMLGYSHSVTDRHASLGAVSLSRYAGVRRPHV